MTRTGLSLLEVILATAILLAATVTLGRLAFVTTQHAQRAEDRTIALEIADYQMQRILLGQLPLQSQARGPVLETLGSLPSTDTNPHPWDDWQFAVQVAATNVPRVYRVQIDVIRVPVSASPTSPASFASPGATGESSVSTAASPTTESLFQYSAVRLIQSQDSGAVE